MMEFKGVFVIKFFRNKQYAEDFTHGKLYFNPINYFKNIEENKSELEPHNDSNEGSLVFPNLQNSFEHMYLKNDEITDFKITEEGIKIKTSGEFIEEHSGSLDHYIKLEGISDINTKSYHDETPILCFSRIGYKTNDLKNYFLYAGDVNWLYNMFIRFEAEYAAIMNYQIFCKLMKQFASQKDLQLSGDKVRYYDPNDKEYFRKSQTDKSNKIIYPEKTKDYEIEKEYRISLLNTKIKAGTFFDIPETMKKTWESQVKIIKKK